MDTDVQQQAEEPPAPPRPARPPAGVADRPDRTLRAVAIWHGLGAAGCAVALWAAVAPSGNDLPGVIRWTLTAFFLGAGLAQVAAAVGVLQVQRRARTLSLAVSYLVFVVTATAVLNSIGVFVGFSDFATGFAQGVWLMVLGAIGAIWWWAANRIRERAPKAAVARWLRTAAQVLVYGALAGLAAYSLIGWLGNLDPPPGAAEWYGDVGAGLVELVRRLLQPLTLGALALSAGSLWAFRTMWKPAMAFRFGTSNSTGDALSGILFLSPNLLGFIVFFAGPLLFSLVISFFDWDSIGQNRDFIGFANYAQILALDLARTDAPGALASQVLKPGYLELMHIDWFGQHWLLGARDRVFWISLRNIVIFLALAVPLSVVPALILSTILNSKLPGMKVFRAIFFIPSVAGVIGVTLIWRDLYGATVGWVNYLLTRAADILPFIERDQPVQQPWLTDTSTALLSVVIVFAWMTFGFNTVLYLAGHQAIPGDLYEAAELDGANVWRRFTRITIPQLRNTTFYVVATTSILAMQLFDIVWILTNPPGSPDNATQTPVLHLYFKGFQQSQQGYASAVAWVLFVLIFGLTVIQFRRQQEEAGVN
jgi:ABC-type sugar transport system permease subunit